MNPVKIYTKKSKIFLFIIGSLAFSYLGVYYIETSAHWFGYTFFVICWLFALVFATLLIPSLNYIEISKSGLVVKNVFNSIKCDWSEVIGVGVTGNGMVALRLADTSKSLDKASVELLGYQKAIPNFYQLCPSQIVDEIDKAIKSGRT